MQPINKGVKTTDFYLVDRPCINNRRDENGKNKERLGGVVDVYIRACYVGVIVGVGSGDGF